MRRKCKLNNMCEKITDWNLLSIFEKNSEEKIALIQLNTPIESKHIFKTLWEKALLMAVVDGAVNKLFELSQSENDNSLLPNIIAGDFDSAKPQLLEYYKQKGVEIVNTPDQNETDFTKCLRLLTDRIRDQKIQVDIIVVFVSFGGRLDHILANINTLHKAVEFTSKPVYLFDGHAIACLLPQGQHRLNVDCNLKGKTCSLIPIGQPCPRCTTTGLKWNLRDQSMEFGGLVSTSNKLDGSPYVTVKTDTPLLWTLQLDDK